MHFKIIKWYNSQKSYILFYMIKFIAVSNMYVCKLVSQKPMGRMVYNIMGSLVRFYGYFSGWVFTPTEKKQIKRISNLIWNQRMNKFCKVRVIKILKFFLNNFVNCFLFLLVISRFVYFSGVMVYVILI